MDARSRFGASILALLLAASCLSIGEAEPLRYYRAETVAPARSAEAVAARGPELRLRRLDAAGHLRERIAVRVAPHQYELLEQDRWSEPPLAYVERALSRALFESDGLRRSESLSAPPLDVALLAFEEVREPDPAAVVALAVRLFDADGRALLEREFVEREPLSEATLPALAAALTSALERVSTEVAGEVRNALESAGAGNG